VHHGTPSPTLRIGPPGQLRTPTLRIGPAQTKLATLVSLVGPWDIQPPTALPRRSPAVGRRPRIASTHRQRRRSQQPGTAAALFCLSLLPDEQRRTNALPPSVAHRSNGQRRQGKRAERGLAPRLLPKTVSASTIQIFQVCSNQRFPFIFSNPVEL
jgi:hypothetical protein